jgi:hypothetical protein
MSQIEFPRNIDNVLAQANDTGLLIVGDWSVAVPKAVAIEYAQNYNTNFDKGFYEMDGKVYFSHLCAKIVFTKQEASAIVELIKEAYI